MLSINAVKGFEYGSGFAGTKMLGSQHNDIFKAGDTITTETNHSGGIQGEMEVKGKGIMHMFFLNDKK